MIEETSDKAVSDKQFEGDQKDRKRSPEEIIEANEKEEAPQIKETEVLLKALGLVIMSLAVLETMAFGIWQWSYLYTIFIAIAIPGLGWIFLFLYNSGNPYQKNSCSIIVYVILIGIIIAIGGWFSKRHWDIFIFVPLSGGAIAYLLQSLSYNKYLDKYSMIRVLIVGLTPSLILISGIMPLSKYHDVSLLEKSASLAEIIEVRIDKYDDIEIRLPSSHADRNNYLNSFLYWGEDPNHLNKWSKTSIKCTEGKEKWYKVTTTRANPDYEIPFNNLILRFEHQWETYENTKKIPEPNAM
ncbi:hypothetical protein KKA24_02730 [Patescibacteria group bacterium]|nr:hypothetical protein [Patescibacteria group bacterium]